MIPLSSRLVNRRAKEIYDQIRQKGSIAKQDLQELSGYTISTLSRILDELIGLGLIVETGYGESTGGRRPTLYQTKADYGYVFGLDISRAHSRLVLCDMHLHKLDSVIWPMTSEMVPERLIAETIEQARQMLVKHGIAHADVLGMGIGAVGPLDREQGVIHETQGFPASGWTNIAVCDILREALELPVVLDNGANTALLGEYWSVEDASRRREHLLYVHVGVGIRSAVMVGGKIAYGAVDMEGAIGQMIIESAGVAPIRSEGNYGAWESYITVHALEQMAIGQLKRGRSSKLRERIQDIEQLTYTDIEWAYMAGDELAREIYMQAATYFSIGLANLLNILHPQKVILGGPIAGNIDLFYEDAVQMAIAKTTYYPKYQIEFQRSKLHDDAVAIGAASLVLQQLCE